jgi:ribosomal protein S18 acetylase RimI-like enzyme
MKTPKHPLENAVWWSLQAEHRHLGEIHGRAGRYRPEVSPFAAVESFDEDSWNDLRVLVGVSRVCVLFGADIPTTLPSGWLSRARGTGYQLVLDPLDLEAGNPVEIRSLMTDDVPQMLELVSVTRPGPFLPETIAMGSYFGHFRGGHLVAMAGERFRFDGFGEVSAVCTHPDTRGQGLASALTNRVARGIVAKGRQPFLHVAKSNEKARRIYESLGFREHRLVEFLLAETPPA